MTVVVRETGESDIGWVDATGLPAGTVKGTVDTVARQLASWVDSNRNNGGGGRRRNPLFDRSAYLAPNNQYSLMQIARAAVANDDVVSGVCDVTEGLIFQGIKWESPESDEADIFNQLSRDLNLDEFIRIWHREEFTYSQVVVGTWWGRRSYTVRGRNAETNVKRKKTYELVVPIAMTFLDPMKIVPMTPGPFGQDRLAWIATKGEMASFDAMADGSLLDPMMKEFVLGKAQVSPGDKAWMAGVGIDPERLLELNPALVWRYCRTKAHYERFSEVRLKSVLPLLDLKQQLIESDRVALVGAANYILLVRKGDKDNPASQPEIDNLKEGMTVVAKLPVIVGDHRLQIDIITPDQEFVLASGKYDTLDKRILNRALGALTASSSGQRNESTLTVARGIGRLLESRRLMLKRTLEFQLARRIMEHPANVGKLETEPNLAFTPRQVQLDSEAQVVQAILAMRNSNDLSRESFLEYFGFDQEIEAQRRQYEDDSGLDDIFQTFVPFSAPAGAMGPNGNPVDPKTSGGQGGRPVGGGTSKKSPAKTAKPRTGTGNVSTKQAAKDES